MKEKLALFGGARTVTMERPPYPVVGAKEVCAATEVILSGNLSETGRRSFVKKMEEDYASYFGVKYALSLAAGTAAIHAGLFAVGVGPGDEVLTPNNTWISAITAIMQAGGVPVFCDVKPGTHEIDPVEIKKKASPHTKAVIVTHMWGIPIDMDPLVKVTKKLGLAVLEDCSHAHGAKYKGRLVGTIGEVGCFSLQGSKAIVAGEGGILITNSRRIYEWALIPGHHGERLKEELTYAGLQPYKIASGYDKLRIAPLSAAIATVQLTRLDELNANRQANFDRLYKHLKKSAPFISWPKIHPGSKRGWYSTPAFYNYDQKKVSRDLFVKACNAQGANVAGNYYDNWYQTPLLQDLKLYGRLWPVKHTNGVEYKPLPPGSLPHNEDIRARALTIPIPALEVPQYMDQVAEAISMVAANMDLLARYQRKTVKGRRKR